MKAEISKFIQENIPSFHQRRLESLEQLQLEKVLLRKNPYLFKAKNMDTAAELVSKILDAHLSSQEETIFGAFLESVAIYACQLAFSGRKSSAEGIDLEFDDAQVRYIVSIKSGPNWGNSSQIKRMKENFKRAKVVLRQNAAVQHIVAVNGCCYGRDNKPDKGDYFKYCGERFWTFVSGDPDLFVELIEPLGFKAKERNESFLAAYAKATNRFTSSFIEAYCDTDYAIDWQKIVRLNSANTKPKKSVPSES